MSPRTSPPLRLDRRRFVQGLGLAGAAVSSGLLPGRAAAQAGALAELMGDRFTLDVGRRPLNITGRPRVATTVNGSFPAPTLRWREGDTVTIDVANRLAEPTSIHWHGIRSPAAMDGVPGLSFRGIMPGETFAYRIPLTQAGTYWYHSHSGMQEQTGLYGAIVVAPRGPEPHPFDREHVIVLSDWTDEDPMTVVANLKQEGDYYNFHQRTLATLASDVRQKGVAPALREAAMWWRMRMTPTDLEDVSGATYTYLLNGRPPAANWTGLFRPGERVRLRFINGSAMTLFDVRIPGLTMNVVQTDGFDVAPVPVDEFRIGVAETYDVIVTPSDARAYTIFAQSLGRMGYARATLAPRAGMSAPVPAMDPVPRRTMKDMGMGDMQMAGMDMSGMNDGSTHAAGSTPGMPATPDMARMPGLARMPGMAEMPAMTQMRMDADPVDTARNNADAVDPKTLRGRVNVDNVAMSPLGRLGEAGDGLDDNGRRVLRYTDLKALRPNADRREPSRDVVFHLTGNMQRWTWGFDGKKFSESAPIQLKLGERVRFVLINDTMMEHPIHLHGLFSELENGQGAHQPLKHTVTVKPGEKLSYLVSADAPGHWAFHCHLLYHMETGMFRTVVVS